MLLFFNARKNSSLLNHEVVFIAFMTQRIPNIIKSCSLFHHLKGNLNRFIMNIEDIFAS